MRRAVCLRRDRRDHRLVCVAPPADSRRNATRAAARVPADRAERRDRVHWSRASLQSRSGFVRAAAWRVSSMDLHSVVTCRSRGGERLWNWIQNPEIVMPGTSPSIAEDLARSSQSTLSWGVLDTRSGASPRAGLGRPTAGREIPRYKRLMNWMPLVSGESHVLLPHVVRLGEARDLRSLRSPRSRREIIRESLRNYFAPRGDQNSPDGMRYDSKEDMTTKSTRLNVRAPRRSPVRSFCCVSSPG